MARRRSPGVGSRRGSQLGFVELFTRPEQHPLMRVLGFLVRYRAELTVTTVLVTVALVLRAELGPDLAMITLAGTTLIVFAVPASRRYVLRRSWCVYTRHRIRTCFVQTGTMTYDGRMPFLLWSRPSEVGERVRVWLPAGLSVKDLDQITDRLAVSCWAQEARVEPCRRQAALAVVEIVRRDPLATGDSVAPAVLDGVSVNIHDTGAEIAAVVPLPNRADLVPVPAGTDRTPPAAARPARPKHTGTTASSEGTDTRVTGFGGVDVSDYV